MISSSHNLQGGTKFFVVCYKVVFYYHVTVMYVLFSTIEHFYPTMRVELSNTGSAACELNNL